MSWLRSDVTYYTGLWADREIDGDEFKSLLRGVASQILKFWEETPVGSDTEDDAATARMWKAHASKRRKAGRWEVMNRKA